MRDIAAYTYSRRGPMISRIYENAFIASFTPGLSGVAKVYHDKRSRWSNTIFTFGPIIKFDKAHYAEFTYAHGSNTFGIGSDYFAVDLNREVKRYRAGAVLKRAWLGGYYYNLLIASLDYHFPLGITAYGKMFLSKDSQRNIDRSVVAEAECALSPSLSARFGYTRGGRLYDAHYSDSGGGNFYSFSGGFASDISGELSLRYILEGVHFRSSANETKQTVVCDIRF